jgi:uncharacterized protein YndB with AHSA1/START domain
MATNNTKLQFVKDFANNKIIVTRIFEADLDTVWDMWTRTELLDQWWAPKPWRSETKSSDFRNGGRRVYAMVGPEGERHWAFGDFSNIVPKKSFEVRDGFSDENGVVNKEMPQTDWKIAFEKSGNATKVVITLIGPGDQLKRLVEMGFEEGFVMAMENLDEILASQATRK